MIQVSIPAASWMSDGLVLVQFNCESHAPLPAGDTVVNQETKKLEHSPDFIFCVFFGVLYAIGVAAIAGNGFASIRSTPHPWVAVLAVLALGAFLAVTGWASSFSLEWTNEKLLVTRPWGSWRVYPLKELWSLDAATMNLSILRTVDGHRIALTCGKSAERRVRKEEIEEALLLAMSKSEAPRHVDPGRNTQETYEDWTADATARSDWSHSAPADSAPPSRPTQTIMSSLLDCGIWSTVLICVLSVLSLVPVTIRGIERGTLIKTVSESVIKIAHLGLAGFAWFVIALFALSWWGRVRLSRDGIEALNGRGARQFVPWATMDRLPPRNVRGGWLATVVVLDPGVGGALHLILLGHARRRMMEALPRFMNPSSALVRHFLK